MKMPRDAQSPHRNSGADGCTYIHTYIHIYTYIQTHTYICILWVHSTAAAAGRAGASQASAVEVPEGAEGEVARVLQSEDYYEVLGVPTDADADTLKRAKRQKSLSTHPDKLHQAPGSNEAFARVTEVGLIPPCVANPVKSRFCLRLKI